MEKENNRPQLYYMDITAEISAADYDQALHLAGAGKRQQIERYRFPDDARRSLFADMMIRYLAATTLGLRNDDLLFAKSIHGKPYLTNDPHFQYNISHSGRYVLCGIHHSPIGVDIEQLQEVKPAVAKRVLSPEEYPNVWINDALSPEAFLVYWTLKESYMKCIGEGMLIPFNSIVFEKSALDYQLKEGPAALHFATERFHEAYQIAVAFYGEQHPLPPTELTHTEILKQLRVGI